jgi:putative hydrolase of the HAD superfamily
VIAYILFDLDHTLYSSKFGLENNVRHRIREYTASFLGLSAEDAWKERIEKEHIYGTNLEWLIAEKGFTDIDSYLKAVHPPDEADTLLPDPALNKFLEEISIPKAILTNSPREHADRILGILGMGKFFTHIFDIRLCNYTGKPSPLFYNKALEILGLKAETVLFIDDIPRYIEGFINLGGKGILFDENNLYRDFPHPKIQRIQEIADFIE